MPDRTKLQVGDKIHFSSVPLADLQQRESEIERGDPDAGWTADTIERIIAENPILVINRIDEYNMPWFDYTFQGGDGPEEHTLAIMENDSWDYV